MPWSSLWVVSIKGRVAASAYSRSVARVGALGFLEKLLGVFGIVLAFCNANFASSVAWPAAIEAERAGVVFLRCGGDVRAGHDTVAFPPL